MAAARDSIVFASVIILFLIPALIAILEDVKQLGRGNGDPPTRPRLTSGFRRYFPSPFSVAMTRAFGILQP